MLCELKIMRTVSRMCVCIDTLQTTSTRMLSIYTSMHNYHCTEENTECMQTVFYNKFCDSNQWWYCVTGTMC